ncbi:hypothetical protein [Shimazuella kribbensis]|uniref:hypothetical protein n=1 Tax=Shimazuella kribbensis TaxID=139808 RepID=UPI00040BE31D|nr:hypothetical protein [Shimazuella kribbensis]
MLARLRPKKSLAFVVLSLVALVISFLPANQTYAAYEYKHTNSYHYWEDTSVFRYYSGGLGIKVYCQNTSGDTQKMTVFRKINGSWSARATETVYCYEESKKYNYFYYSGAVSGSEYYLRFENSGSPISSTTLNVYVNPS